MNLPDFICIGAQKAGTAWLYETLQQNPNIWLSPIKELHFFDSIGKPNRFNLEGKGKKVKKRAKGLKPEIAKNKAFNAYLDECAKFETRTAEWYSQVFSWPVPAGTVRGEVTPSYLDMPEKKIKHARELLGEKKVILIIRDPIGRMLSQLRYAVPKAARRGETVDSDESWLELYTSMRERSPRGVYSASVPLWHKYFGEDHVKILPFGHVRDRPHELVQEVEDFIGAKRFDKYKGLGEPVHTTHRAVIPDAVAAQIREDMKPEVEYLTNRFGAEFYQLTK